MSELKPCPFCGESSILWQYISPWSAKISCGNCGAEVPNTEVRTAYYLENDPIPKELIGLENKQVCAKDKDGNPIEMYWVKPIDSFRQFGHIERWNKRILKTDLEKFIDTYKHFGIEVKFYENEIGNIEVCLSGSFINATHSEKFDGYGGFYSDLEFTKEGKFIRQGFFEQ